MTKQAMPQDAVYDLISDIHGHERLATGVKWYEPPHGHTYRTYAMASESIASDLPLPDEAVQAAVP